jgi:hypothetical protein
LYCTGSAGEEAFYKEVSRLPSPDLKDNFKSSHSSYQRFSIKLYYADRCNFAYKQNSINANDVSNNSSYSLNRDGILHIDSVKENLIFKRVDFLKYKKYLLDTYELITPIIICIGFLSFSATTLIFLRMRKFLVLYLISLAFWVLLFSRLALLILVYISSFPALIPLYLSAAYPVAVIASLLSIAVLMINYSNYLPIKIHK